MSGAATLRRSSGRTQTPGHTNTEAEVAIDETAILLTLSLRRY